MNKKNNGLIIFFTGPMFSGKSERLLETINCLYTKSNNKITENDILAIKPTLDERDGGYIVSRNRDLSPIACIQDEKLNLGLLLGNNNKKIIVIDEVQFFKNEKEDLQNILLELQKAGKIVLIAGLDRIADGTEWENYKIINSINDVVVKQSKAICDITGLEAEYSAKIAIGHNTKKTTIQMANNEIIYFPICKGLFNKQQEIEDKYNEYYQQGIIDNAEIFNSIRLHFKTFDTYDEAKIQTAQKLQNIREETINNVVDLIIKKLKVNELNNDSSSSIASNKDNLLIENNNLQEEADKYESGIIELKTLNRLDTQLSNSEQSTYLFNNTKDKNCFKTL